METPKVPTCYERWCKAILPSSFSFSKEELPLNLPVFLTLPQHSKAICPQFEQLGFFVPFPMAMPHFPTILEISVKTNISFLTPPLGGQLPTVAYQPISESHPESLKRSFSFCGTWQT